jgi:hypothetical protein
MFKFVVFESKFIFAKKRSFNVSVPYFRAAIGEATFSCPKISPVAFWCPKIG